MEKLINVYSINRHNIYNIYIVYILLILPSNLYCVDRSLDKDKDLSKLVIII